MTHERVPQRIQRRRTKGWRMPEGAVYVGRPTRWGNDYRVLPMPAGGWRVQGHGQSWWSADDGHAWTRAEAHAFAVDQFRARLRPGSMRAREVQIRLGGRDLVCWCPPTVPCHADVLLEIANPERSP